MDVKIAIVTGASSGMGECMAINLAKSGFVVVLAARRKDIMDKTVATIEAAGGRAIAVKTDVTNRGEVKAMVEVARKAGAIEVLVNCAGVMYFTLMKNLHEDEWEAMIDINCKGVVNCCGAVLTDMMTRRKGHIINISSDAAKTVFPALTVYNASKAFVATFSKGLRAECVGTGIRVTDVQPGDVATNLIIKNSDQEAAEKVGVAIGKKIGEGAERSSYLDAQDVVDVIMYSINAPAHVGMHEVLIEARDQCFGDPTALDVSGANASG